MRIINTFVSILSLLSIVSAATVFSFEPAKAQEKSTLSISQLVNTFGDSQSENISENITITQLLCGENKVRIGEEEHTGINISFTINEKITLLTSSANTATSNPALTSILQCLSIDPRALMTYARSSSDREYVLAAAMLIDVMISYGFLSQEDFYKYEPLVKVHLPVGAEPSQKLLEMSKEVFVHFLSKKMHYGRD